MSLARGDGDGSNARGAMLVGYEHGLEGVEVRAPRSTATDVHPITLLGGALVAIVHDHGSMGALHSPEPLIPLP